MNTAVNNINNIIAPALIKAVFKINQLPILKTYNNFNFIISEFSFNMLQSKFILKKYDFI